MLQVVILAAGKSQRFSGIKQLAQINGQTLIERALSQYLEGDTLLAGIGCIHLVLGANQNLIRDAINARVSGLNRHSEIVKLFNAPHWQQGLGSTLADFCQQFTSEDSSLLVGLADQAFLCPEDIKTMIYQAQQNPKAIIAAKYNEVTGVPAIFPQCYFNHLATLQGDSGAKKILQRFACQVIQVNLPNAKFDIDTQQDWQFAQAQLTPKSVKKTNI